MEKLGSLLTVLLLCMGCAHTSPKAPAPTTIKPARKTEPAKPKTEPAASTNASVVIFNPKTQKWSFKNRDRAQKDWLPASTFKILHTLIALQSGVVDKDEVFKWNGVRYQSKEWNRDQTLESAFKHSVIWVYQIIAKRIGTDRMQNYVDLCGYGNRCIEGKADSFWLDGGLRITSRQQIEFLRQLQAETLPFSPSHMRFVKKIMVRNGGKTWLMRAKSGWAQRVKPQFGWLVGWVENGKDVWFFATNVEIRTREDAGKRMSMSVAALREAGAIPPEK